GSVPTLPTIPWSLLRVTVAGSTPRPPRKTPLTHPAPRRFNEEITVYRRRGMRHRGWMLAGATLAAAVAVVAVVVVLVIHRPQEPTPPAALPTCAEIYAWPGVSDAARTAFADTWQFRERDEPGQPTMTDCTLN